MKKRKIETKRILLMAVVAVGAGLSARMPVHATVWYGWEYVWDEGNEGAYWYEDWVKQGTEGRGKEIYDPSSLGGWYWLDAAEGGKRAVNKDVYQESQADDEGNIGKWVRYNSEGQMVKGWDITEAGTYYFDPTYGTMAKGSQHIDGVDYFFNEVTGIMESCSVGLEACWVTIDGKDYWYEGGIRQGFYPTTWNFRGKEIYDPGSDAWYWLDAVQQGAKAVSKDVCIMESQANDFGTIGKWVRYDAEGHMVKGWDTNENGTYYFDPVYGTMAKGMVVVDGKAYRFNEDTGICEGEDESVLNPVKNKYDAIGRPLEEYDADGNLLIKYTYEYINREGWWVERREDGAGHVFKEITYNHEKGDIVDSWTDIEYDENGNDVKETFHDGDGNVTGWREYQYDEDGHEIKHTMYHSDGTVKEWTENQYDEEGRHISRKEYEGDDRLAIEVLYDTEGRTARYTEYGEEGFVLYEAIYQNGVRSVSRDYGPNGKITQEDQYDEDGDLAKRILYNEEGNVTSELLYGEVGGYLVKRVLYNEDGRATGEFLYEYDEFGSLSRCYQYEERDGQMEMVKVISYDSEGNVTSEEDC